MLKKIYLISLIVVLVSLILVMASFAANEDFLQKIKGAAIKTDGTPLKVGISPGQLFSEFDISQSGYAKWLLENAGAVVDYVNPDADVNKQLGFMEDFFNMGKDVIIVQPVNDFALADITRRVQAKGVKVFTTNHPIMDENSHPIVDLSAGSPDIAFGRKAAEFLVEKAAGKKVKIVQIMGDMGQIITQRRDEAFREVIAQHPNIDLVDSKPADWLLEKANAIITDMLTATPDIWAIFSQSDCMLPGILSALEQAGRLFPVSDERHIITIGCDGLPYAIQKIREGVHDLTLEQNPYAMATVVAKGALMVAKGIPLPKYPENIIEVEPVLITAENCDDPSLWGNFGVPHNEVWANTQKVFEYYKWLGDEKIYNK